MFRSLLLICGLMLSALVISAPAQDIFNPLPNKPVQQRGDTRFETVEYSFDLPNATWRATSKKEVANAELVYGDRLDGFLQIRKIDAANMTFEDVIDREQNQKLLVLPGIVNGKMEKNFKGNFNGSVANYEFIQSGKQMLGRAYFLKADDKTVYVLRFTALRDKLNLIRNQTDSIARTFKLKSK